MKHSFHFAFATKLFGMMMHCTMMHISNILYLENTNILGPMLGQFQSISCLTLVKCPIHLVPITYNIA